MAWTDYEEAYNTLDENLRAGSRRLTAEEMLLIGSILNDADARNHIPNFADYERASNGDYSRFEKVGRVMRNYLAVKFMEEKGFINGNTPDVTQKMLEENAMNPAFRLGISQLSHSEDPAVTATFRGYDDQMNAHIMRQTLKPMSARQIQKVKEMFPKGDQARQEILKNVEKQVLIAKTLFMAHIGKTQIREEGRDPREPECSVAGMMAHCSRAAYVFPPAQGDWLPAMMTSVIGLDMGAAAGVYGRSMATHSVENGAKISDFKEKKQPSARHQYGMDVAIGGLGNDGIQGKGGVPQTLKNDGSCGHMYMRVDPGNARTTSSILIGFESDSPSAASNQQGHTHTIRATPEYMSSFLGQREDEIGNKYGGRIIDCTGYEPDVLTHMLNGFTKYYRSMLLSSLSDPELAARIDEINQSLCGKMMNADELKRTMGNLGFLPMEAVSLAERAAKVRGIDPGSIKEDDLPTPEYEIEGVFQKEKPSRWTQLKAWLGMRSGMTEMQEYRNYQNFLKGKVNAAIEASDRAAADALATAGQNETPQQDQRTGHGNGIQRPLNELVDVEAELTARNSQEAEAINRRPVPVRRRADSLPVNKPKGLTHK